MEAYFAWVKEQNPVTVHGAEASAMIYSLVETAKANNLKIYEYLKYLLEKIPEHMEDTNLEFTDDLLPWS